MTRGMVDGPLALALLLVGLIGTWRLATTNEPMRRGPWPSLTWRGAAALVCCGAILGAGQLWLGPPRQPLPDIPLLAVVSIVPLLLAIRLVAAPGAATAACG